MSITSSGSTSRELASESQPELAGSKTQKKTVSQGSKGLSARGQLRLYDLVTRLEI